MAPWTKRRTLAAKTLSMMVLIIGMLTVLLGSYHGDWGNPFVVAIGLFGGFLLVVKIVEEVLLLAFGFYTENWIFDRKLNPKFAPRTKEESDK